MVGRRVRDLTQNEPGRPPSSSKVNDLANGTRYAKEEGSREWHSQGWRSQVVQGIEKGLKRPFLRRRKPMQFVNQKVTFELEIQIEELEAKIAPDGGETVLPLPIPSGKKH